MILILKISRINPPEAKQLRQAKEDKKELNLLRVMTHIKTQLTKITLANKL